MNQTASFPVPQGNFDLVNHLIKTGAIVSQEVATIMQDTDRANFTAYDPYSDKPQSIGYSATISAPHMHAYSLVTSFWAILYTFALFSK